MRTRDVLLIMGAGAVLYLLLNKNAQNQLLATATQNPSGGLTFGPGGANLDLQLPTTLLQDLFGGSGSNNPASTNGLGGLDGLAANRATPGHRQRFTAPYLLR